jgi:hypothetical protein
MGDEYYLGKRVRNFVDLLSFKVVRLMRPTRGQEINIDVFQNPEKYLVLVPIEEIVADTKVSREGVEGYKQKIKSGEKIAHIIVVKHPKFKKYAVLDGHHRYYAYLELGRKEVNCALAGDFSSVIFYMTKHGYFQPGAEVRKGIHKKVFQVHENIQEFLDNFSKDPNTYSRLKKENKSETS